MEEFKNFNKYVSSISAEVKDTVGIVKVVPPEDFFTRDYSLESLSNCMMVKSPVQQFVSGKSGNYNVALVVKDDMTLTDFHALASANAYHSDCYEDRERRFWRSLGCPGGGSSNSRASRGISSGTTPPPDGESTSPSVSWIDPFYGADAAGTLFQGENASGWNVDKLDNMLRLLDHSLAGVTNSMLYVGMWRAMFAFHVEDLNLYSINYIHTGAAKSWYSIPQCQQQRFESFAQSQFPHDYHICREFLRHKTSVLSPLKIKQAGLTMHTAVQNAGEFIITFPGAYHQGFNHGFNVAESSNFALPDWIPLGRKAKVCMCEPFNCCIDVDLLETLHLRQKRATNLQTVASATAFSVGHENANTVDCDEDAQSSYFRCSCGVRGSLPLKLVTRTKRKGRRAAGCRDEDTETPMLLEVTSPGLFRCNGCDVYVHANCNPNTFEQLLCHLCADIEMNSLVTPSDSEATETDSDSQLLVAKNSTENSRDSDQPSTAGPNKESDRSAFPSEVVKVGQKGDLVRLTAAGGMTGNIVDMHLDTNMKHGRIHVRGTRKQDDIWINLYDTSLYTVLSSAAGTGVVSPRVKRRKVGRPCRSDTGLII